MRSTRLTFAFATLALAVPMLPALAHDEPAALRGAQIFKTYCRLCHGELGKGDGRAAALQQQPPSDLTMSRRSDEYKVSIIRGGGAAMNRSSSMPAWRDVLSEQQITDVVAYLRVLAMNGKPPEPGLARAEERRP